MTDGFACRAMVVYIYRDTKGVAVRAIARFKVDSSCIFFIFSNYSRM